MKYLAYILSLILGLGCGILLMNGEATPQSLSTVQVNIRNATDEPVINIVVTHEDGSVTLNTLASGRSQILPLLVFGESSYKIEARLQNGDVVYGHGGYVEPGYTVEEVITKEGIMHRPSS